MAGSAMRPSRHGRPVSSIPTMRSSLNLSRTSRTAGRWPGDARRRPTSRVPVMIRPLDRGRRRTMRAPSGGGRPWPALPRSANGRTARPGRGAARTRAEPGCPHRAAATVFVSPGASTSGCSQSGRQMRTFPLLLPACPTARCRGRTHRPTATTRQLPSRHHDAEGPASRPGGRGLGLGRMKMIGLGD